MSVKAIVFSGPSMGDHDLPQIGGVEVWDPCKQGDVYLATLCEPKAIGIIDGYFEGVPSVWHKEILYAMSRGIHVFGASSMGALRAAELDGYGMVGIGKIYEQFRDNALEDDDEVALVHGPAELGSPALSIPMVNVRATLQRARKKDFVTDAEFLSLINVAKNIFYKQRTWNRVLEQTIVYGLESGKAAEFQEWVQSGYVDQKKFDAIALFEEISARDFSVPFVADFEFEETEFWFHNTKRWYAAETSNDDVRNSDETVRLFT